MYIINYGREEPFWHQQLWLGTRRRALPSRTARTTARAVVGLLHYSHRSFPLLSNLHLTLVFLVRLPWWWWCDGSCCFPAAARARCTVVPNDSKLAKNLITKLEKLSDYTCTSIILTNYGCKGHAVAGNGNVYD